MTRKDDGPGVPEAIPRTLQGVVARLGGATLDRIWIFDPRIKGRRESGLVVLSRFTDPADPDRRRLFTASYQAERTGKGLTVEWALSEEGAAPPDRLPPVMEGVVRRAGDDEGEAREVHLGGDEERLAELFAEFDADLLDPELWPAAAESPVPATAPADGGEGPDPEAAAAVAEAAATGEVGA